MSKIFMAVICILLLIQPVSALEIEAPEVPASGREWMPQISESFGSGLWELVCAGLKELVPNLKEAMEVSTAVIAMVLLLSLVQGISGSGGHMVRLCGAAAISAVLLGSADAMVRLGSRTVMEISDYTKLLLPVMTTALAAQGGVTTSAALYAGTAVFDAVLTELISSVLMPGIWLYLGSSIANAVTDQEMLKRMADLLKSLITWILKTTLMIFTTYLGITGVVSGTTDTAALKATKVTISSFVPVVGGILSDASEAVLVGAGLMKNAAGIYGIFAVLAVALNPFLKIGAQYLVLKVTAAVCAVFGGKGMTDLIAAFSTAMGLLLAMTGCCCVLTLVSTVCFLRGVG